MIRDLVDGADLLFTNEYESRLLQQKTGWNDDEVLARVGTWVTTRAAEGVLVRRAGAEPISVIAVPETKPVEPTGGGDALRAGFIAGRMWGLSLERATQLGSAVATAAVEVIGTQEYDLPRESFLSRFAEAFGDDAAAEVAAHLPCHCRPPDDTLARSRAPAATRVSERPQRGPSGPRAGPLSRFPQRSPMAGSAVHAR